MVRSGSSLPRGRVYQSGTLPRRKSCEPISENLDILRRKGARRRSELIPPHEVLVT